MSQAADVTDGLFAAPGGATQAPAVAPPQTATSPSLERLKRWVSDSMMDSTTARTEAELDVDYYDGKQFSRGELAALAERNQPDIAFNRVKPAVNGIIGVVSRARSQPKALPRTPNDTDSADVATDVLRYIADYNRFPRLKQDCFKDMLVPGTMAALVTVDQDMQVNVNQIRWEEFFADTHSRRADFKDGRFMGVAKWMNADDVAAIYPEQATAIDAASQIGANGIVIDISFQDRPNSTVTWANSKNRRLLVVEIYYRWANAWERAVFYGSGILEQGPSPYLDHKRRPDNPIEAMSAYVDRNNARYGAVRDMRGPQDEINKRRSKLLHLISVSQIEATDIMSINTDVEVARKEAAKPDGVIPAGWRKVSTADMAAGQAQLLAEAKGEIERMGPNPAVLGRQSEDASGRALLARQQAGLVELALLYGGLEDWELRIYRQCWARVKQYWRAPQYIRVTDDEDAPKFVGLNVPIAAQPGQQGQQGQASAPDPSDPASQAPGQPGVLGYKNNVAEMDVDIELDTVQDVGTIKHEQFQDLMQLVSSSPIYQQQVPLWRLVQLSDIPHARGFVDALKQASEQQAQSQQQQQQTAEQMAAAKTAEVGSKAQLNSAQAETALARAGLDHVTAAATASHQHARVFIDAVKAGGETVPQPAAGASSQDDTGASGVA